MSENEFAKIFEDKPSRKKVLKHLKLGHFLWSSKVRQMRKIYPKVGLPPNVQLSGHIKIGEYSYIGNHSSLNTLGKDELEGNYGIRIGRFCSMASYISLNTNSLSHSTQTPGLFPVSALFGSEKKTLVPSGKKNNRILIGNDVWIAASTTVLGNVTIGNGAIIASHAVVVKDVPPYHLAAGNPTQIKKKRFSDHIIKQLEEIRWWDWSLDKLKRNQEFFSLDIVKNPDLDLWEHIKG